MKTAVQILVFVFIGVATMNTAKAQQEDTIFPPRYIGGEEARLRFLKSNLVYPQEAQDEGITGTVYVFFIVNEDGNVEQVELLRGIGGGCDEEAVRVAKMMPRWQPGKRGEKEIQRSYIMPIKFPLPNPDDPIEEEIFMRTEQPPKYLGGEEARLKFIQTNLVYPQEAREKGIQGTVYIGFVVEKDGSIEQIHLLKGISGDCDKEAARIVSMMPKWSPGSNRGKEVNVRYTMPIKFDLAAEKEKERMKAKQEKKKQKKNNKKASTSGVAKNVPNSKSLAELEQPPRYIGGDKARLEFLRENLVYPQEAKEKGIQGTVYVEFIVGKDGSLSDVKVLRGIGGGCDEEAIRVVTMMPKWYPGKREEKEVQRPYIMSIEFPMLEERGESDELIEEELIMVVEQVPKYPGGDEARLKFIQENLIYPQEAKDNGIQGTVYVGFAVEKDGSIGQVRLLRGIGGGCDTEAVRVVLMMPNWEPAQQRGKMVRCQYNMPIKFDLAAEKEKNNE